ncbi:hypothetical protein SNEBB_010488 [Seison nebaliae]|nr:hypothetical protein SNEBB_010488 [Seison nebaliae]
MFMLYLTLPVVCYAAPKKDITLLLKMMKDIEVADNGNSNIEISQSLTVRQIHQMYQKNFSCPTKGESVARITHFPLTCTKVDDTYLIFKKYLLGRMLKTDSKSLPDRWADDNDFDTDDDIEQDITKSYKSQLVVRSMDKFKYIQLDIHTNNRLKLRMIFYNNGSKSTSAWFKPENLYQIYGPFGNDVDVYEMKYIKIDYKIISFFKTQEHYTSRYMVWIQFYAGCPKDPITIGVVGENDICGDTYFESIENSQNYYIIYSRGPGPKNVAGYRFGDDLSIFGLAI